MTTYCNSDDQMRRFFGDYLTSVNEQPSHELSQLEKYSPVYISLNRQPALIEDNEFESNMGIFGGAVAIDNPNFTDDVLDSKEKHPYVMFKDNTFNLTQAYLTGNAIYMRSTRQRGVTNETMQVCGGGLTIQNNTFTDSNPIIHASNGGSISLECDFVTTDDSDFVGGSSNW